MNIRINYRLQCEVDQRKCDFNKEHAHCHITRLTRHGIRVAKEWLNPVRIKRGHSMSPSEINEVLKIVSDNRYALRKEYEKNRRHGAY